MLERTFQKISEDKVSNTVGNEFFMPLGWSRGMTWIELMNSRRVLIVSEAGVGKTYECREQARRLWESGEPAFFLELATLASEDLRSQLSIEEEDRLDVWLSSQSDIATFFLDSVDELKLTLYSFENALKRFNKSIRNQLRRARIIITTRPIPFDNQLVRQLLPVPQDSQAESNEDTFAKIAMRYRKDNKENDNEPPIIDWQTVALMPLSDTQIVEFAKGQGIAKPEELLIDLQRRNAQEFARRPQDLIELCADWRVHKKIRTHFDQVTSNIRVKLQPSNGRTEPAELSANKALEGACRIALAMQMTRQFTIRHSAASDVGEDEAALNPASILTDWRPDEIKALLERPLFGFASYGRVRFHHRSVAEFLAALRLYQLREQGIPLKALKRLLFAETKSNTIVRPSKRPIAGWLALKDNSIFELLRDNEPSVLLSEGDPESLTQNQRNQALRAYCLRYGSGGWRGLQVPHIQIHRLASKELANEINQIWLHGIENPDVREILLSLIEVGRLDACSNIPNSLILDVHVPIVERIIALDALIALDDPQLDIKATLIVSENSSWLMKDIQIAALRLFPKHISVNQLCHILQRTKKMKRNIGEFSWQLPRLIATAKLVSSDLFSLRDGLVKLISESLKWQKEWPNIISDRSHLTETLAATCVLGLDISLDNAWLEASLLALRLHSHNHSDDESIKLLSEKLRNLSTQDHTRLFWVADAFHQALHKLDDPWQRFSKVVSYDGPIQLNYERDVTWICSALSDLHRDLDERTMILEAALYLPCNNKAGREYVKGLKRLVADVPSLVSRITDWLKPPKSNVVNRKRKIAQEERKKQAERKEAKNYASWVLFWREIVNEPEKAFSSDRKLNTALNLSYALKYDGGNGGEYGWNRRLIEDLFNQDIADIFRDMLMKTWREEHPKLPSEKPEGESYRIYNTWQLGLAGIYAEAEDQHWAQKLSEDEAVLAVRYTPIQLNGVPHWIEALAVSHPTAVEHILGNELRWELNLSPVMFGQSLLIHAIGDAPQQVIQLLIPHLLTWLNAGGDLVDDKGNEIQSVQKLLKVTEVILKHGDMNAKTCLLEISNERLKMTLGQELHYLWLSVLMRISPVLGLNALESQAANIKPAKHSQIVTWIANLFGDRRNSIDLNDERFTPQLLLRLVKFSYIHVRIEDDSRHEGSFSPDTRDDAQYARNSIVSALFNTKGENGLRAKYEMATDPLCTHFKDRIIAVAQEKWAEEIDSEIFDEIQAAELDQTGEAGASTNEGMFAIMNDRLSDLNDLLLLDVSPREAWADISDERIMRREIARELRHASNSIYTVDQESVTADEKETDIRLRSAASNCEAVIELKLGDNRTARDLRDTIEKQLLKKYMAAEESRSGSLLVTISKNRTWQHPETKKKLNIFGLHEMLCNEAERVQIASGGSVNISIHLLDLRPRLTVEVKKDKSS